MNIPTENVLRRRARLRAEGEADLAGRLVSAIALIRTARRALRKHDLASLHASLEELHRIASRARARVIVVREDARDAEAR